MNTEGETETGPPRGVRTPSRERSPDIDDLLDELEILEEKVRHPEARAQLAETIRVARRVDTGGPFGNVISGFDRADAAEALVGSVVFGIPMLVEGGTLEVGAFIATHVSYLLGTGSIRNNNASSSSVSA